MNHTVLRADEYFEATIVVLHSQDKPLIHRVLLAELETLTERFADAVEAGKGLAAMDVAIEISQLRAILASHPFQRRNSA